MSDPGGSLRLAVFADGYAPLADGVAGSLARLVRLVRARGGDVRVFTPGSAADALAPDGAADVMEPLPSVPLWSYPDLRLASPGRSRVVRALAAWRPTLVHAATPFGVGLAGRAAARSLGVPFVTSFHPSAAAYAKYAGFGALRGPGWAYLRWFHNGGARTYAPSRAVATELRGHGFEHLAVWSRGVDLERFDPGHRSAAMRTRLGADDASVVIATAGRGSARDLAVAARAVALVRQTTTRHVVWTVAPADGDRPIALPDGAVSPGPLDARELGAFHASADVFLAPFTGDTADDSILGAMASGVPVLAAGTAASRELLGGMRGAWASAGDVEATALRLISLIGDRIERAVLRENALAFARRRGWDDVLDDLLASYTRVMRDARAGRPTRAPRRLDVEVTPPAFGLADLDAPPRRAPSAVPAAPAIGPSPRV